MSDVLFSAASEVMLTMRAGGGGSDVPTLRMEMPAVGPGAIASGLAPCIWILEKLTDITRLFPKVSKGSRSTIDVYRTLVISTVRRNFAICARFLPLRKMTWILDCPRNTRKALTIPFKFSINRGVSPISIIFPHRSIAAIKYTPRAIKNRLVHAFRNVFRKHCFAHLCNISKFSETLMSTRMRKGAMMATLRSDHPDMCRFSLQSHFTIKARANDKMRV